MSKMNVEVLRIGQRVIRDDRVTTHVALVARAFGASKIYMNEVDPEIEDTIKRMNKTWGGEFKVEFFEDWKKVLSSKIKEYKSFFTKSACDQVLTDTFTICLHIYFNTYSLKLMSVFSDVVTLLHMQMHIYIYIYMSSKSKNN